MASYSFSYEEIGHLTRLGWLARIPLSPGLVEVLHGSWVEVGEDWFVEGCWDGPFEAGEFDRSRSFYGSGIRLRGDKIVVAASRATVDSVLYCQNGSEIVVSNSMLLLLSAIGARLDPKHSYEEECSGVLKGIRDYKAEIPVLHSSIPAIRQFFFGNLHLEEGGISTELPGCTADFADFGHYVAFITGKLKALHGNATSSARARPMKCYATLSSGYDSTAIAVLARDHCQVDRCITTKPIEDPLMQIEDARPIAAALGIEPTLLDGFDGGLGERELFYYAANYNHFEMMFDKAAQLFEAQDSPTLLLTGYHGDKVWEKNLGGRYRSDRICRGDMSGKGLCEIRLKSGFINAAIPFLGAEKASQIIAISQSSEMAPWSVGGDYDRPIPRRIGEEAGLSRDLFGHQKHKITSHKGWPRDPGLKTKFAGDLTGNFGVGRGRFLVSDLLDRLSYRLAGIERLSFLADWKRAVLLGKPNLRMFLFIWAVNTIVENTKLPPRVSG